MAKSANTDILNGDQALEALDALETTYIGLRDRGYSWKALWPHDHDEASRRRAELLWGQDGAELIEALLTNSTYASKLLEKEFRIKKRARWSIIVSIVLFGKLEIAEKWIYFMKMAVDGLYEMSHLHYCQQRGIDYRYGVDANAPTKEQIMETETLHARGRCLEKAMTQIYTLLRLNSEASRNSSQPPSTTSPWGLILARPKQFVEHPLLLDAQHEFDLLTDQQRFAFDFGPVSRGQSTPRSLQSLRPLHGECLELHGSLTEVIATIHQDFSHKPLEMTSRLSSRRALTIAQFERSTGTSTAEMALVLASWLIMLWGTPWAENMCSCQIFPVNLRLRPTTEHCKPPELIAVLWPRPHECDQHDHLNFGQPLYQLGTVLAELALLVPSPFSARMSRSTKAQALQEVYEATSVSYKRAVEFCVSSKLQKASACRIALSNVDRTDFYRRHIIAPLHDHYTKHANVADPINKLAQRRFARQH
ncbi:hypothetical protein LTR10_010577 [Elasticomyces elasticus]|nr:hypothetical protein LTR10_010577 [Elasticomyces elasticus]KAK4972475.1 hypothetical protein LTR42_006985 [Elasticomyces elasticus]